MSPEELALLRELQTACLREADEFLNSFRETLAPINHGPVDCIRSLQKIIHSLKGNLQAVAYTQYGEFVHELETKLTSIEALIQGLGYPLAAEDAGVLEFFLSNVLDSMEDYVSDLRKHGDDSPALLQKRSESLDALSLWMPTAPPPPAAAAQDDDWGLLETVVEQTVSAAPTPVAEVAPVPAPKPPVIEESDGSGLYLLFQNGAQYFAIGIEHIVEVIKARALSAPPARRRNLFGLLNLRGEVLPIVRIEDLPAAGRTDYVVVAQQKDVRFGFPVESVHRVVSLDGKDFQLVDSAPSGERGGRKSRYTQLDGKTVAILQLNPMAAA